MRIRIFIAAFVVLLTTAVRADQFGLDVAQSKDTVYFRSTAQLEFIEGKTNVIAGSITVDPSNISADAGGILQCDLQTLKTGIDMRDEHMRDRYLHTEKYPYAYFELKSVSGLPASLQPGTAYQGTAIGYFYIHGGKRQITAPLTVTLHKLGDTQSLTTKATFTIKLDDYGIERPKAIFMKLAETIEIEVVFNAINGVASTPISLPNWPELK